MFTALLLTQEDKRTVARFERMEREQLPPGDVTVRIEYSSLNFKDALAVTGRGAIVKKWPLVPGIDLAGVVEDSTDPAWKPGDRVVVNGWGLGETHWGGFSQYARLAGGWLLRLPEAYSTRQAMAVGTAGYTAALCVMALRKHGLRPGDGEVLVTGATGGVGSVAVTLLAGLGYTVTTSTGRPHEAAYLKALGAQHIIDRAELSSPGKPLQSERWAGVIDTAGSHTLANACAATRWNGAVAACGLAQGGDFPATVMPFILRGVSLLGINSGESSRDIRETVWQRLASDLKPPLLKEMCRTIPLRELPGVFDDFINAKVNRRIVVDLSE